MEMNETSLVPVESVLERTECLWSQCVKPLVAVLRDTFFQYFQIHLIYDTRLFARALGQMG